MSNADGGRDGGRDGTQLIDAQAITFGDQVVEGQGPDQHPVGSAEASSYYATQSGVVDQLVIYYDGRQTGDDATALIAGLYDDVAGNPSTLLGGGVASPGGKLTAQTWYTINIAEVAIVADRFYWIAAACPVGSGTNCSFQYKYYGAIGPGPCTPAAAVQCTQHSAQGTLVTMPAMWSSGTSYLPSINSYYATHQ